MARKSAQGFGASKAQTQGTLRGIRLELGEFQDSSNLLSPDELAGLKGLGIINYGIVCQFRCINDEGQAFIGLALPSIKASGAILVGIMVGTQPTLTDTIMPREEIERRYRANEAAIRYLIAKAFKKEFAEQVMRSSGPG
ncbi:hypothetical protein [Leptolyngbya sp. CCY15150]|uniref:hypothetical protein n=1 Tax=Leptolyngbya sp. CCY15150 TaxID=2767772 RepID=UPI001951B49E|nr:hypothetical protein [Leptolyngbya sp. CCY15150]